MNNKDDSKPFHIEGLEDWMRQFFDDPFTSYIDNYQFRVDLFETQNEYIVEAELSDYRTEQIFVSVNKENLIIQVKEDKVIAERIVTLPFVLEKKKIKAQLCNDVLEIYIKKKGSRKNKKKYISIKVL